MAFKKKWRAAVRATLRTPLVSTVVHHHRVRQVIRLLPVLNQAYEGSVRQFGFGALHPFDRGRWCARVSLATSKPSLMREAGRFSWSITTLYMASASMHRNA